MKVEIELPSILIDRHRIAHEYYEKHLDNNLLSWNDWAYYLWKNKQQINIKKNKNKLVESMVVNFDFRISFKIIGHKQTWRRNVH